MIKTRSFVVGRPTPRGMQYVAYWWNFKPAKLATTKYIFRAYLESNIDTAVLVRDSLKGNGWVIIPYNR